MVCFNHPDLPAVGLCSQCNKACCRSCIEDVGGALLCNSCIALHHQQQESYAQAIAQEKRVEATSASTRIVLSLLFAGMGAILGFVATGSGRNPMSFPMRLFGSLFIGYAFWCPFWGVPAVWRASKKLLSNLGCFLIGRPMGLLFYFLVFGWLIVNFGIIYGACGGALYEFFKYWQSSRGQEVSKAKALGLAALGGVAGVIAMIIIGGLLSATNPRSVQRDPVMKPASTPTSSYSQSPQISQPARKKPTSSTSSSGSYYVRVFNCDDGGQILINGNRVVSVGFGQDSGWINIASYLRRGSNKITFQSINQTGAITYGFQVQKGGIIKFNKTCGKAFVVGCDNNAVQPAGIARTFTYSITR